MSRQERLLWWLASVALAVLLVMMVAKLSELRLLSPIFLPPPQRIWAALTKGLTTGNLATMSLPRSAIWWSGLPSRHASASGSAR